MRKFLSIPILVLTLSVVMLAACQPDPVIEPEPETPVSSNEPISSPEPPVSTNDPIREPISKDLDGLQQSVYVDEFQILILESFPVQVRVNVVGNLPDGCTSIVGSKGEMIDESTFQLSIFTKRPADMMCTMALVPFEESIILEVEGLSAGTYMVKGFGLEDSFTLDVDNK